MKLKKMQKKMKMINSSYKEIAIVLSAAEEIYIFPHIMMDGDSLGSSAALCRALRNMGKTAWILIEDKIPDYLEYLDEDLCTYDKDLIKEPDVCIAVDCSDSERLGKRREIFFLGKTSINIDHHSIYIAFADINHNDNKYASAAEMIYDLLLEMKVPKSVKIAEGLYTGIITDTGNFQYSNTNSMTLKRAADLLDWGLDHQKLIIEIYQSIRPEKVRLTGKTLWGMELFYEGKGAIACVTREALRDTGAMMEETEGLSEILRNIKGVEISVLLKEWGPKLTRASLRAKTIGDVAQIAQQFGGGGHIKAAGCTIEKDIEESKKLIKTAIEEQLRGLVFE